jgi:hypothetical protein
MESIIDNHRDSNKIINLSNFSHCVHRFTLRFKDEALEKEYPTKRVTPFGVTVFFKIFLCLLIVCIGIRRIEVTFLTACNDPATLVLLRGEIMTLSLFVGALIIEVVIHFYKPFNFMRGFFAMLYIYIAISSSSYYSEKASFFIIPMYFLA